MHARTWIRTRNKRVFQCDREKSLCFFISYQTTRLTRTTTLELPTIILTGAGYATSDYFIRCERQYEFNENRYMHVCNVEFGKTYLFQSRGKKKRFLERYKRHTKLNSRRLVLGKTNLTIKKKLAFSPSPLVLAKFYTRGFARERRRLSDKSEIRFEGNGE